VHGGDLLYRSRVRASLVERALAPLKRVADLGIPVILALGNHERSRLPFPLLGIHPGLHLLDYPKTVELVVAGARVAVSGFPCERQNIGGRFKELVEKTGYRKTRANLRLLCIHQTVEGCRVGPADYFFRAGPDVIRGRDLPAGFAAVLAGHIHRHQVLSHDPAGRPLVAPVLYPGSIERTSFAERRESKGFLTLDCAPSDRGGRLRGWKFHRLPTRPMVTLEVEVGGVSARELERSLASRLAALDPDSVVKLQVLGAVAPELRRVLGADNLRALSPASMTIDTRVREAGGAGRRSLQG
jgi:DNA repair exonuclease SbcCD nuclease subunit